MSGAKLIVRDEPLPGLILYERWVGDDERGRFSRTFCADELSGTVFDQPVSQINVSETRHRGTVRGLHFQHPPHAETKLVTCLRGQALDIVVDLRRGSPTFLHVHQQVLDSDNHLSLLIPQGFAHGFQTLSDAVLLLYAHDTPYCAEAEDGIDITDPRLSIQLPLPITDRSARDCAFSPIADDFQGISS